MSDHMKFMQEAIRLSAISLETLEGGPFGCVIVRDGSIIGRGWNQVTAQNDPTAHAEIVAIRDACRQTGSYQLHGCDIYTSCEPCPMCLGAIYWSRPRTVYYANTRQDAAAAGFDDQFIYDEIPLPPAIRRIPSVRTGQEEAIRVFEEWLKLPGRPDY